MVPALPIANRSTPDVSALAEACLGYLAEHPEELLAFMEQAGLSPDALRQAVGTERLQRGLIDHFASNEAILLALCANAGITPENFMQVWHRLNRTE